MPTRSEWSVVTFLCSGIYRLPSSPRLQNNFPFFCCWQQQVFTSLPVSVQVIFGEAADAIVATG
jgi:hypothetical protein